MRILYRNEEGFLSTVNVYYAAYNEDEGEKGLYISELYREGKVDLSVYRVTE